MKNLFIVTLIIAISAVINAELTAKIESCSGWSLNKLPKLKQFLKGDTGAITYRNVEIEFIRGKKATMSIMDDGVEVENVILSDYEVEGADAMHSLFKNSGFEQLSEEELQAKLDARDEIEKREEEDKKERRRKYVEENEAKQRDREGDAGAEL